MKANVPLELNERQAKAALQFGAVPVSEERSMPKKDKEKTEEEIKEEIQVAIQEILDAGDELGATGTPKINQVRRAVPEATPKLRDEVWESFFAPKEV